MRRVCYRLRANSRSGFNFSGAAPKTVAHAHSQCKRWRPHKIGTQTRLSPKTVAHAPHSQCKRWRLQQNRNPIANQPEDGRTRAECTMPAVAAPTKLKPRRESTRRRSHTRRIHNASGGGLTKLKLKRESAQRRSHTRRIHNASRGGPTKLKPKRE